MPPISIGIGLDLTGAGGTAAAAVVTGPDTSVSTAWAGDVTQTTFTAAHTTAADTQGTRLVASTDPTFATGKIYSAYKDTATKTVQHTVSGLTADTAYYFCIEVNGTLKTTKSGSFKTMAASNSFRFAFGGCQSGYNNGKVLGQLQALATVPRFFVHLGDLHYDDIGTAAAANGVSYIPQFDASIDSVLGGTYSGPFLRQMPTYSVHDDHDFGPNDSGIYYPDPNNGGARTLNPSRSDSLSVFRRRRPNPALAFNLTPATDPVCFSFVQGRIRFVVTDMRSQRDDVSTVLGTAQKAWFKAQIDAAYAAGQFVCWVHSTPFLSAGWSDGWDGFTRAAERQEIATYIVSAGMGGRIFCLTGDYHMMAADSGACVDYADLGGLRMPVFHACGLFATLVGSAAPYDQGVSLPKTSVAGYCDVTDNGTTVALSFTGIGMNTGDTSATTILTMASTLPVPTPTVPTAITLVQENYKRFALADGSGAGPTTYTVSSFKSAAVAGNLLLLFVGMPSGSNTGTLAAPSGWTRLGADQVVASNFHQAIFYKVASGSETSVTITTSGPRTLHTAILEFSNVDTGGTPFGQDATDLYDGSTTRTTFAPSFTPSSANEVALVFGQTRGFGFTTGVTWASGYVQRFFQPAGHTAASGFIVASNQLSTSGVAETATASWTGTADKAQARAITLRPSPNPPSNTVAPVISGTAQDGLTLSTTNGTWANNPTAYAYQWKRSGVNIGGATSGTYTLIQADVGSTITCTVTATNSGGSVSATSAATATVTEMAAPSNTVAPAVTGTATTGNVLSSTTGTWTSNTAPSYAYQWKRNGSNISAATGSTYTLQVADEGTSVVCAVTATNPGGSASASSNTISPTAGAAVSRFDSTTITFDSTSHKMDEN